MCERLLRVRDVLERIPISRTAFLTGVRMGKYPQPIKIAAATTCWRAKDIDNYIINICKKQQGEHFICK